MKAAKWLTPQIFANVPGREDSGTATALCPFASASWNSLQPRRPLIGAQSAQNEMSRTVLGLARPGGDPGAPRLLEAAEI